MSESMGENISESLGGFVGIGTLALHHNGCFILGKFGFFRHPG
jgi:hypothetical protein